MVELRLECVELPPLPGVLLGVQVRKEVEQVTPVEVGSCVLTASAEVLDDDVRGPYVHGRRGERFLYLSWGTAPGFTMFRRAKLQLLPHLALLHEAASTGQAVVLRHALTLPDGTPACATIRPVSVGLA